MTGISIPGINAWGETQLMLVNITQLEKQTRLGSKEGRLLMTGTQHALNIHPRVLQRK